MTHLQAYIHSLFTFIKAKVLGKVLHQRLNLVGKTEVLDAIGDAQGCLGRPQKGGWGDSP